ncbi:MAG: CHAT domain-containing protein [Gemmatimonadaceae bacterium]
MLRSASLALLLASATWQRTDELLPRRILAEAHRAIAADSTTSFASRWAPGQPGVSGPASSFALGTLARLTYDYGSAERYFASIDHAPGRPQTMWQVYARLGRAQSAASRWRNVPALQLLEEAMLAARRMRLPGAEVDAILAGQPIVARSLGADSANAFMRRAELLAPQLDAVQAVTLRCARGALVRFSNPARSDSILHAAIGDATHLRALRVVGNCQMALAVTLEARGYVTLTRDMMEQAHRTLTGARDDYALATLAQFDAYVNAEHDGDFSRAKAVVATATHLARRTGNVLVIPWANLNLAQRALRIGDVSLALRATQRVEAEFTTLGDRSGLAAAALVAGDAHFLAGRLTEAESLYSRAVARYGALRYDSFRASGMFQLVATAIDRGDAATARTRLAAAMALARQRQLTGFINADQYFILGRLDLLEGRYASAAAHFRRFNESQGWAVHTRFDADMRVAEALALGGRFEESLSLFDRGTLSLETWRSSMKDRELRVALMQGRRKDFDTDLGLATIVSAFARAGRTSEAFRIAEKERARHLWLQLERRQAISGDSAEVGEARRSRLVPPPVSIDSVRASLPPRTALVAFVTGRGREPTTAFVVTRASAHTVQLMTADSLIEPIERFSRALEGGLPATGLASSLGATILAPLLDAIGPADRLVLVPDGPFHRVPFDALRLPDGQAVVQRFAVSLAPSARLALEWWNAAPPRADRATLVFANPSLPAAFGQSPLPFAAAEGRAIGRLMARPTVLSGARASEHRLKNTSWADVGILHIATHADVADAGLSESAFYLAAGGAEDGRVGVEEVSRLPLHGPLVVLSACRTLGGVIVNGEGVQGLSAPFLEAGARAVAATYWLISDRRVVPLMNAFYQQLARGRPLARALRDAKLASIRAGASPAVWAAFMIVGDGELRPVRRPR